MAKKQRCVLCGKEMLESEGAARITTGAVKKTGAVKADKLWGETHDTCLFQMLPSSKAALSEISRLVAAAKVE
jgi:hypothetical protein